MKKLVLTISLAIGTIGCTEQQNISSSKNEDGSTTFLSEASICTKQPLISSSTKCINNEAKIEFITIGEDIYDIKKDSLKIGSFIVNKTDQLKQNDPKWHAFPSKKEFNAEEGWLSWGLELKNAYNFGDKVYLKGSITAVKGADESIIITKSVAISEIDSLKESPMIQNIDINLDGDDFYFSLSTGQENIKKIELISDKNKILEEIYPSNKFSGHVHYSHDLYESLISTEKVFLKIYYYKELKPIQLNFLYSDE